MADTREDLNRFRHDVATWRRAMLSELQKLGEKEQWRPLGFDVPAAGSILDPAVERDVSDLLLETMTREIVRAPFKLVWWTRILIVVTVVLTVLTFVLILRTFWP